MLDYSFDFTGKTRKQVERELLDAGLTAVDRAIILRSYDRLVERENERKDMERM